MTSESGSISISINDNTQVPAGFDLSAFIQAVLQHLNISQGIFEINLVDNDTIIAVNKAHLDRDYATDVITFNLESTDNIHGDVYLSTDHIQENATAYDSAYGDELKLCLVHSILHLLDYRDYTDAEKERMSAKQDSVLAALAHETF